MSSLLPQVGSQFFGAASVVRQKEDEGVLELTCFLQGCQNPAYTLIYAIELGCKTSMHQVCHSLCGSSP